MRVKILPLLCQLGLVLRLGALLVWFVSSNRFGGVKCHHLPCIAKFSRFVSKHCLRVESEILMRDIEYL